MTCAGYMPHSGDMTTDRNISTPEPTAHDLTMARWLAENDMWHSYGGLTREEWIRDMGVSETAVALAATL